MHFEPKYQPKYRVIVVKRERTNPYIGLIESQNREYATAVVRVKRKMGKDFESYRNNLSIAAQVMLDDHSMPSYEEILLTL